MLAQLALSLIAVFAAGVSALPVSIPGTHEVARRSHSQVSFNRWNNIQSLDGFDNFYGIDDFNGFNRAQTIVSENEEVCHSVDIVIIQQRLAVLQEMAKRIITETICEVETQTIVFEQYFQSLGHFRGDLRRHSGHKVGHDRGIVSHFGKIFNPDGSFCTDDWHFTGHDIGSQTVVIKDNWNEVSSPRSVDSAFFTAHNAYYINRSS